MSGSMNIEGIKKLTEKLGISGKSLLFATLCVIGVALILFGNLFSAEKKETKQSDTSSFTNEEYNAAYVNTLKEEMTSIISQIEGVGRVNIAITLEAGVSYEYAAERSYSDDSESSGERYKKSEESSLIILDGENGEAPVLLKKTEPTVMGVAVVCEGGDNPRIIEKVTDTISVLCGIGSNRVSVSKMT